MTSLFVTGPVAAHVADSVLRWHSHDRITLLVCADDPAGLAAYDCAPGLRPPVPRLAVGAPWVGWEHVEGATADDVLRARDEAVDCPRVLVAVEAQRAVWVARGREVRLAREVRL